VSEQWRSLLSQLVPRLEALVEADRGLEGQAHHRVRIGLYSFHDRMVDPAASEEND
jgi:hypothetical protein